MYYYGTLSGDPVRLLHETSLSAESLSAICPYCYRIVRGWSMGLVWSGSQQPNYENWVPEPMTGGVGELKSLYISMCVSTVRSSSTGEERRNGPLYDCYLGVLSHSLPALRSHRGRVVVVEGIQISVAGTRVCVFAETRPDIDGAIWAAFHDSLPSRPCG